MGDRITFRGRGCAESEALPLIAGKYMPTSIVEPRVKFIKGWLTGGTDPDDGSVECGPLTDYPMIVTLDQLTEIFYRVKAAWFTQGTLEVGFGRIIANPGTLAAPGNYEGWSVISKGYMVEGTVPPAFSSWFTGGFANSELAMWAPIGGIHWSTDNATNPPTYYHGNYATAERLPAKWSHVNFDYIIDYVTIYNAAHTGFNFSTGATGVVKPAGATVYAELRSYEGEWYPNWADAALIISRYVAYTDADHPFDPSAKLYLGIRFEVLTDSGELQLTTAKVTGTYGATAIESSVKLKLKLSGEAMPECVIGAAGYGTEPVTGTDFILAAKEWWPYATTTGSAAWDTTTGLPANGGPSA